MKTTLTMLYNSDRTYYAIPGVNRECALWISIETFSLPVPLHLCRPAAVVACVIRGRDYYRVGIWSPLTPGANEEIEADSDLVKDYRDAVWWTPTLTEAWTKLDEVEIELCGLREALARREAEVTELQGLLDDATKLHICEVAPKGGKR